MNILKEKIQNYDHKQLQKDVKPLFEGYQRDKASKGDTELVSRLEGVVGRLPAPEEELIQMRYLDKDSPYITHSIVYDKLGISYPTYRMIQKRALIKVAFAFYIGPFEK